MDCVLYVSLKFDKIDFTIELLAKTKNSMEGSVSPDCSFLQI